MSGQFAIRQGDWKYVLASKELYNVKGDIGKTTNLAESKPEKVESLIALLRS